MLIYEPPVESYVFLIGHIFHEFDHRRMRGYSDLEDSGFVRAILGGASDLCRGIFLPLNAVGDRHGCVRHSDGSVSTPPGFSEAYQLYCRGGWASVGVATEFGGQDLPRILTTALSEMFGAANQAFDMYLGWGESSSAILGAFGTDHLRMIYLPKLVSGEWSASMALTEAQAGTNLGAIRTRAVAHEDGSYRITGTKIFNSGGEHDLTDNIVHFVLARIQGAPPGTSGLSLFLMPKMLFDPAGCPNVRNQLSCGGVEQKMGLHGSATCTMHYDEATAWIVGDPGQGVAIMFRLMNHMRRRVGAIALGLSEIAYQNAAAYAATRMQGRYIASNGSVAEGRPLVAFPDVRRTLMEILVFNDAARALLVWSGLLADISERAADESERNDAAELSSFLTPILKGYLTEIALHNILAAQQLFGGHGYMVETGIEQLVRDARMLTIAEGATGVQAFDLAMRQLRRNGGAAAIGLGNIIGAMIAQLATSDEAAPICPAMTIAVENWRMATRYLLENADLDEIGAKSNDYLHLTGMVLLGHMWLCIVAGVQREASPDICFPDPATFHERARFWMDQMVPETTLRRTRIIGNSAALHGFAAL